jgi:uroporphyrinogen decarboxylase
MTINYLNYQISEGVQVVQLFESIADQIDRPRYQTFVQPYHEQIFAALDPSVPSILFAKECPYLSLMLNSGADVLSVGKCVDLSKAQKEAKGRVAFQGNVDNAILRDGACDDITAAVNNCLQAGGKVGHILNLSHGLHRDTPFENVKHFVKVAKEARN